MTTEQIEKAQAVIWAITELNFALYQDDDLPLDDIGPIIELGQHYKVVLMDTIGAENGRAAMLEKFAQLKPEDREKVLGKMREAINN